MTTTHIRRAGIPIILVMVCAISLPTIAAAKSEATKVPPELTSPNYRTREIAPLGYDAKLDRQDPSNVIRVGKTYYVWYTQRKAGVHPYASTVYYATSADGLHFLRAAKVRHVHTGCGPFDPDAHANVTYGRGITWGVAQHRTKGRLHLVRFDVACKAPAPSQKDCRTPLVSVSGWW